MKLREKSRMQNCMHDTILSKKHTSVRENPNMSGEVTHYLYQLFLFPFFYEVYTFLGIKYIIIKPLKFLLRRLAHIMINSC